MQTPQAPLGKKSQYPQTYNPSLLFPITRAEKRIEIGIDPNTLPFSGLDYWTHYEVSCLNKKGKPLLALAEMFYACNSPYIVESKSLKLYFNSLNNSKFQDLNALAATIKTDLENCLKTTVSVKLTALKNVNINNLKLQFDGNSLDDLDITVNDYTVKPSLLKTESNITTETLHSDLLKSNCLVTQQPDWGSLKIQYTGQKIQHENLLRYILSFRNHNEFHEQCIERIFTDIMQYCQPIKLTVYGRYTRRGGIEINPIRSTEQVNPEQQNIRLIRQ